MVNGGMVKAGGFAFFPAAKIEIFRDFTPKTAIPKVR